MKTATRINTRYTDIGHVKVTDGQIKKHYTMFTSKEQLLLSTVLKGMKLTKSYHIKQKEEISHSDIIEALSSSYIVEFNHNNGDSRCLLRGHAVTSIEGLQYNLCVVVSMTSATIVTAYYNKVNDSHNNINMNRYSDFKILDYL